MASVVVWDLFKLSVEKSLLAICNKCKAEVPTDRGVKTLKEMLLNGAQQRFGDSEDKRVLSLDAIFEILYNLSHGPLLHT